MLPENRPCPRCHEPIGKYKGRICRSCSYVRWKQKYPQKDQQRRKRMAERQLIHRTANPEFYREKARRWHRNHPGSATAFRRATRLKHPEVQKAYKRRAWQRLKSNPIKLEAYNKKQRGYHQALRLKALKGYGAVCRCCPSSACQESCKLIVGFQVEGRAVVQVRRGWQYPVRSGAGFGRGSPGI